MRTAKVFVNGIEAAQLTQHNEASYELTYLSNYSGPPVSLALPVKKETYQFDSFPSFFEGVLPEGGQLEALLKQKKIDAKDYFSQLIAVGEDLVGAVTVYEVTK